MDWVNFSCFFRLYFAPNQHAQGSGDSVINSNSAISPVSLVNIVLKLGVMHFFKKQNKTKKKQQIYRQNHVLYEYRHYNTRGPLKRIYSEEVWSNWKAISGEVAFEISSWSCVKSDKYSVKVQNSKFSKAQKHSQAELKFKIYHKPTMPIFQLTCKFKSYIFTEFECIYSYTNHANGAFRF